MMADAGPAPGADEQGGARERLRQHLRARFPAEEAERMLAETAPEQDTDVSPEGDSDERRDRD